MIGVMDLVMVEDCEVLSDEVELSPLESVAPV
jgi:hypothetical protein